MARRSKEESERKKAVALEYSDISTLPRVLASGQGAIAEEIIALAKEHNIPVKENDTLAELLTKIQKGSSINQETFRLVAEVISWLYISDCEFREKHEFLSPMLGEDRSSR